MLNRSFTGTLILPFEGEPSFESIANPAKLRALFEQEFSDALPSMPALESEFSSHPTSSLVTIQCYPWVHGGRLAALPNIEAEWDSPAVEKVIHQSVETR